MELLYSRAAPGPEFVSLSGLLRSDISGEAISCHLGDPLLLPSPLCTISQSSCVEVLTELHFYINSILKAPNKTSTTFDRFLQEDEKFLFGDNANVKNNFRTQIFRPKKCHGIAMQYHLTRDRKQISHLVPLILNSSKLYSSKNSTGFEIKDVSAVVFCVGMGGDPSALGTSGLVYSLSNRMKVCMDILCRASTTSIGKKRSSTTKTPPSSSSTTMDVPSARSLLTTLLLTDDEDRITNAVVKREHRLVIFQEEQFTKKHANSKRRSQDSNVFEMEGDENPLHVNSADQGRIIVERMAVLSVSDSDTMFRKYEGRTRHAAKAGKKRLRKTARDADLDGFDFRGEKRSSSIANLARNSNSGDDVSVSARSASTNMSNLTLKGPKKDTMSRTSNRSKQLLASNGKDSSTPRNRRISVDQSVSGGRSRNMVGRRSTSIEHGIGNGNPPFSSPNQSNYSSTQSVESDGGASLASTVRTPPGSIGSRNQTRGRQQFDTFAGRALSTDTSTTASEKTYSKDLLAGGNGNATVGNHRDGGPPKVLVNVALNEDLTCFYKLSKLSSCSVEGVIQVQVRSNIDQGVPFFLLIRDPSKCIQSIQENKKFADSMADTLPLNHRAMKSDHMFTISVPKADDYFPVMRYKCSNDLRPVPIVSTFVTL
jgi:hypothetical protein